MIPLVPLTKRRLLAVHQGYPILQGYSNPRDQHEPHIDFKLNTQRTKSYFNSFMSSSVKLDHIPHLKNICTFMMHDHIGCTWFHLSHLMENPIPHELGSLNIPNLTHVPWHQHLIHIRITHYESHTF